VLGSFAFGAALFLGTRSLVPTNGRDHVPAARSATPVTAVVGTSTR
jgi:hypothetical protein